MPRDVKLLNHHQTFLISSITQLQHLKAILIISINNQDISIPVSPTPTIMSAFKSTSSAFGTQAPTLFGRGGYNAPNDNDEDDEHRMSMPVNMGRGGYNRGDDDDEEEDGRGGYN